MFRICEGAVWPLVPLLPEEPMLLDPMLLEPMLLFMPEEFMPLEPWPLVMPLLKPELPELVPPPMVRFPKAP